MQAPPYASSLKQKVSQAVHYCPAPSGMDDGRVPCVNTSPRLHACVCVQDFSGHVVVADIGGGYGELLMEIMTLTPGDKGLGRHTFDQSSKLSTPEQRPHYPAFSAADFLCIPGFNARVNTAPRVTPHQLSMPSTQMTQQPGISRLTPIADNMSWLSQSPSHPVPKQLSSL